jgi:hypothetical protein
MTPLQDLIYRRLLDVSWDMGGLPNDPDKLAVLVRLPQDAFDEEWKYPLTDCWEVIGRGKMLVNNRQESERQKFTSKQTLSRNAAEARWKKYRKSLGVKEKRRHADASDPHSGRTAEGMQNTCLLDPDPECIDTDPKLAKQDLSLMSQPAGKKQRGSSVDEPLVPPGVRWSKISKSVEMTDEFREWLGDHLRDLSGRENLQTTLTTREAQESLGRLNGNLLGAPYKTNGKTLPSLVVNWFENDLRRKANRGGKDGRGRTKTERSHAAIDESIELIKRARAREDERG